MTHHLVFPASPTPSEFVPDDAQARVLEHGEGPLLVLAGPGTGKTATIVELVARRVEAGVPADQVLLLTFSRKAAEELRERLALRLAGGGFVAPTPSTFHSFAWSLLRARSGPEDPPLRLLSGPEQDVDIRELLRGSLELGRPQWPASMREGLLTAGMAQEVQRLLAQARVLGLDPADLIHSGRPEWSAAGKFFEDYLDALAPQGKVDYSELVHRASLLAERDPQLQERWSLVVVDEFQDTDASQERLLRALTGPEVDGVTRVRRGASLIVVGDPDQSIYAFRGADPTVLTDFLLRFADSSGVAASVVAMMRCRRSAPAVLAAGRCVAVSLPVPLRRDVREVDHRDLECAAPPGLGSGQVEVLLTATPAAEAEILADLLRQEHVRAGTPWERMAVLVRAGSQMPTLERAMLTAGVPVVVASDEVPLASHQTVQPLLWILRAAQDPSAVPDALVLDLLSSPLVGADAIALRRLGRALRERDGDVPRPGQVLLAAAVRDPTMLDAIDDALARPARQLSGLLARLHDLLPQGALWALWSAWSGSVMEHRLAADSAAGGAAGRVADRGLDAVVALFAAFERSLDRHGPGRGVQVLLDELQAQLIPADTLADRGIDTPGVRLLTAHRSKGLEWDVVMVAGVQDGVWPDLRTRGGLLNPEQLAVGDSAGLDIGSVARGAQRLQEERRLFYVAITRARRRLIVTASVAESGPSSFLDELGVARPELLTPRPRRPHTVKAHVADLRARALSDDAAVRATAVAGLAAIAASVDEHDRPLVPQAHPDSWWDVLEPTVHDVPMRDPAAPIQLSGSQLETLDRCGLQWFLQREAGGDEPTGVAQGFGTVVHAVAEAIARDPAAAEPEAVAQRLESVWQALPHRGAWLSERERAEAVTVLECFVGWHRDEEQGGQVIGVEHPFDLTVTDVEGQSLPTPLHLRGTIDRVVRTPAGEVLVQDLKTGKSAASKQEARTNAQLGLYQLAVDNGALDGVQVSGGAQLIYPRKPLATGAPTVREQPALAKDSQWLADLLVRASQTVRNEDFAPAPGDHCERCSFARCCPAVSQGHEVTS